MVSLHQDDNLSARRIAGRLDVSHGAVLAAPGKLGIARELNCRLVPTKNAGLWQANAVGKILRRVAARAAS